MRLKRTDSIAVCFFVVLVGVFFRQTLFEGKLPVPADALVGLYHPWRDYYSSDYPRGIPFKNFLITDPVRQQIPWRKIVVDGWKTGEIPSWNPYNFSGTPTLANIQAAALYPLNILFFLFSFADAWTMLIILQPLLAGLFMYWYLRSLAIRPIAGLLGAVAWSFSGLNVAWLTWGTIGHVALWLPLALLAIDKIIDKHKLTLWRNIVFWSLIFVVSMISQLFAGHAQISLYFMFVVIAYGATRIFQTKERNKAILLFALLLSISILLTAAQWLPLLDWIQQSNRIIDGSDWHKEGWFIPWEHLVQFVAPDFFGNPTTLNYWGKWNYGEFVGYVGLLPLLFAIIAIVSGVGRMRLFWLSVLVIALLFALPTPIASLPFVLKIPILSSLQPTRLIFVIDFALTVLAALGCYTFFENGKKRHAFVSLGFIGILFVTLWVVVLGQAMEISRRNLLLPTILYISASVLLFLYKYKRVAHVTPFRNIVTLAIIGIVGADLIRFGWKFTPFTPREYFFPKTKIVTFLKEQEKPFRVMSIDKRILPPNTSSYFGIESVEGYDPIISSRYEELMAAIARGKPDITPPFGFNRIVSLEITNSSLLPILNARYILSLADLSEPYLTMVFKEGETNVYEDSRALPRVYAVERPIVAFGKEETMKALYAIKDVRHEAVVEGNVSILSVPMSGGESVSLTRYESNRLEIDTQFAVPRLLVVANAYNPGWHATIDGRTTRIYRTNYAFQGVVVPEGTHKTLFWYTLWK